MLDKYNAEGLSLKVIIFEKFLNNLICYFKNIIFSFFLITVSTNLTVYAKI
jgi:hypothetical protein